MSEADNASASTPATADQFKAPTAPASLSGKRKYGLILPEKPPESQQQQKDEAENKTNDTQAEKTQQIPIGPDGMPVKLLYDPPFWSAPPPYPYYFEVIKEGKIVERIDIHSKGHYLIGRAPFCDILMEHQSVSRQHAVIQFRKNGDAYVYDLGSTHGTFLNKKPVRPKAYQKLRNGSILQFGQSTRMFFLQGGPDPEELERKKREEEEAKKKEGPNNEESGKPVYEDPDMAALKKWRAKQEEEAKKQQQKSAKEKKKAPKPSSIPEDEVEEGWIDPNFYKEYYGEDDDDDDEFYDRTSSRKKQEAQPTKPQTEVETYDTLSAKKVVLEHQKRTLLAEISALQELIAKSKSKKQEDELDSFMESISSSLEEEKIKRKQALMNELESELQRVTKLLAIAKPSDFHSTMIDSSDHLVDKYMHEFNKKRKATDMVMESKAPPPKKMKPTSSEPEAPPPEKAAHKITVIEPKLENKPDASNVEEKEDSGQSDEAPQNYGKSTEGDTTSSETASKSHKKRKTESPFDIEVKYEEWVPPEDQTGDGITSLNAKYGY